MVTPALWSLHLWRLSASAFLQGAKDPFSFLSMWEAALFDCLRLLLSPPRAVLALRLVIRYLVFRYLKPTGYCGRGKALNVFDPCFSSDGSRAHFSWASAFISAGTLFSIY